MSCLDGSAVRVIVSRSGRAQLTPTTLKILHTVFCVLNGDENPFLAKLDKTVNGCGQVEGEKTSDLAGFASQGLVLYHIYVGAPNLQSGIEEVKGKLQTSGTLLSVCISVVCDPKSFHGLY